MCNYVLSFSLQKGSMNISKVFVTMKEKESRKTTIVVILLHFLLTLQVKKPTLRVLVLRKTIMKPGKNQKSEKKTETRYNPFTFTEDQQRY